MEKKELAIILKKHSAWINGKYGGERADLKSANLQSANLQSADLRGADLQSADLRGADLQSADLRWADLDYSCLPLWCGGSKFKADMRIVRQILAHVCAIEIMEADESIKAAIEAILPEAKKSHRASDLGIM